MVIELTQLVVSIQGEWTFFWIYRDSVNPKWGIFQSPCDDQKDKSIRIPIIDS